MRISKKFFLFSSPTHARFCANIDFLHSKLLSLSPSSPSHKHHHINFTFFRGFGGRQKENKLENFPPKLFQVHSKSVCRTNLLILSSLQPHIAFLPCIMMMMAMMTEGKTRAIMLFQYLIMVLKYFHFIFSLTVEKGPSAGGAVKTNLPGGDGYWLDPSGIVWRSHTKSNHIPDYAPVCTSTTTTTLPEDEARNR
jgi:hypothetical protein